MMTTTSRPAESRPCHNRPDWVERRRDTRVYVPGTVVRVPCRPFAVQGARAQLRSQGMVGTLLGFSQDPYEVLDLSKGGLAFRAARRYRPGTKLRLRLSVPDRQGDIELSGRVRWARADGGGQAYTMGVEFDPFGDSPGRNPRSALDALCAVQAEHARTGRETERARTGPGMAGP